MILDLSLSSCFTYNLLGFLGKDLEDIKKLYSSSQLVIMNTSETVTTGNLREAGSCEDFLGDLFQFSHHCQQSSPRDLARAQERSMWFKKKKV